MKMHLSNLFRKKKAHNYESLSRDSPSKNRDPDDAQRYTLTSLERRFYVGTALPWTISAILSIAFVTLAFGKEMLAGNGSLGSYENGFTTDIGLFDINLLSISSTQVKCY